MAGRRGAGKRAAMGSEGGKRNIRNIRKNNAVFHEIAANDGGNGIDMQRISRYNVLVKNG